ncbi:uncharacterized protein B0I36DRAFT_422057 [Microdochium trichocladiopsis]|uniref:Zn(2)-C6 fungal-type domain-containing protein n=1 Tax=Microdochium trichocladiopsis TaxID=1682393 RepID=A0A9P9BSD3_9PEZI|nr:uncharacterized protein B0I36DRAFT_422057 [Microdochium trichocladiopsis]KAH7033730.1 hypothetical protein B0I36DRAFT_422057 [Microdochium trichocladiopsis]
MPTDNTPLSAKHRVSRACVACRSRKTRCDLSLEGGDKPKVPPCRRCTEKNLLCVLATSRRGGKRIKGQRVNKSVRRDSHIVSPTAPPTGRSHVDVGNTDARPVQGYNPHDVGNRRPSEEESEWASSPLPSEIDTASDHDDSGESGEGESRGRLEGHITSADLLNPSDALDLLAQVANLEPGKQNEASAEAENHQTTEAAIGIETGTTQSITYYPPIASGALSIAEATGLLQSYYTQYHTFFPIAHKAIFEDYASLPEWIEKEQHLVTAILAVVTKDDPTRREIHDGCARHMESLISKLIYAGSTDVGAVEALLILAEWAPQPPEDSLAIGTGKENQGSWMLVGLAVRLAYLQNLEQTTLTHGQEGVSEHVCRQRTIWAACYMSDRQVSIRLGKGFWSRGPGPSISLRAADFPLLQVQKLGSDNCAMLFQAHLEVTQLFSNAHDILYSSAGHREQLYAGGEYVRYIDDLSVVLRGWKLTWGGSSFVPLAKASLMLSYNFLRLYINAFAFQANLHRAVRRARRRMSATAELKEPLFSDLAGAPDARFIYESIDAANSLLSLLNSYIEPETGLKYMPMKFYLYIIYAAVFLLKAIVSGAVKSSAVVGIRRSIHETVLRLQRTSTNRQSLGQRYARSLRLLWQKSLGKRKQRAEIPETPGSRAAAPTAAVASAQQDIPFQEVIPAGSNDPGTDLDLFNSFWWTRLDSLGQFVTEDLVTLPTDTLFTTLGLDAAPDMVGLSSIDVSGWYNGLPTTGDV